MLVLERRPWRCAEVRAGGAAGQPPRPATSPTPPGPLTRSGQVTLRVPADVDAAGRVERAADPGRARTRRATTAWTPVRPGDPIRQTGESCSIPTTGAPVYQLVPATLRPPSARTELAWLRLHPALELARARLARERRRRFGPTAAQPRGDPFTPVATPHDDARPDALSRLPAPRGGHRLRQSLDALYFSVARSCTAGRTAGAVQADRRPWSGSTGTATIGPASAPATRREGFTRRGLITFIGPPDFRASTKFGRPAFWLRARWERGGYAVPPQLRRVSDQHHVGRPHARRSQTKSWARAMASQIRSSAPQAPRCYSASGSRYANRRCHRPPSAPRSRAEEGADAVTTVLDPSGRPVEIWVRWHQMPATSTNPAPAAATIRLDRLTGEVALWRRPARPCASPGPGQRAGGPVSDGRRSTGQPAGRRHHPAQERRALCGRRDELGAIGRRLGAGDAGGGQGPGPEGPAPS